MLNKMNISEFCSTDIWEKKSVGGGLGALQFFGHLKRALELLFSVRMSPILGLLSRYDHPWKKQQQKNKQKNK